MVTACQIVKMNVDQDTPGIPALKGCPDSDGDGISDSEDSCPDLPGVAAFLGCPDTDGDGVQDSQDNCIEEPGPSQNNGCPWPDQDDDGIYDKDDTCPTEAGQQKTMVARGQIKMGMVYWIKTMPVLQKQELLKLAAP